MGLLAFLGGGGIGLGALALTTLFLTLSALAFFFGQARLPQPGLARSTALRATRSESATAHAANPVGLNETCEDEPKKPASTFREICRTGHA
jgi:hypothetical protein